MESTNDSFKLLKMLTMHRTECDYTFDACAIPGALPGKKLELSVVRSVRKACRLSNIIWLANTEHCTVIAGG